MIDILTKKKRSSLMSKVRSSDTKPEWILRCGLHRLGFRYRLNNNHLPGRPDLVLSKYRAVVFVHGCFWHHHRGCKDATMPKSNRAFWEKKFSENNKLNVDFRFAGVEKLKLSLDTMINLYRLVQEGLNNIWNMQMPVKPQSSLFPLFQK